MLTQEMDDVFAYITHHNKHKGYLVFHSISPSQVDYLLEGYLSTEQIVHWVKYGIKQVIYIYIYIYGYVYL
jgi:hypothetical protein